LSAAPFLIFPSYLDNRFRLVRLTNRLPLAPPARVDAATAAPDDAQLRMQGDFVRATLVGPAILAWLPVDVVFFESVLHGGQRLLPLGIPQTPFFDPEARRPAIP
jgi:hypothetical protein